MSSLHNGMIKIVIIKNRQMVIVVETTSLLSTPHTPRDLECNNRQENPDSADFRYLAQGSSTVLFSEVANMF